MMHLPFIKGLDLSQILYEEAVKPILDKHLSGLHYSAALLGAGSDVLGYDTLQSRDHDWGPKLMLFLTETDHEVYRERIDQVLRRELPRDIRGYPTNFDYHEDGSAMMTANEEEGINHRVMIFTARCFFESILNFDPTADTRSADWLCVPENRLLMLTAGRVFHDGLGQLEPMREKLRYYPREVWLYLLAAQWQRISQEEHFMGRCGQAGDDRGSSLVASRLVRDLMRLCFLMERTYAPYIKWFGTAFAKLDCANQLTPIFTRVLNVGSWQERECHLTPAYECVAGMHNALGITDSLPTHVSPFYARPFMIIHADQFVEAIRAAITDAEVLALPAHLGSVDQFLDSTDALNEPERFKGLYMYTEECHVTR